MDFSKLHCLHQGKARNLMLNWRMSMRIVERYMSYNLLRRDGGQCTEIKCIDRILYNLQVE